MVIAQEIQAAHEQAQAVSQQAQATWDRILAQREGRLTSAARKEILRRSAYARLVAKAGTMPVIEQAKGIIMAQSACSGDQVFDLLRRTSQRMNVPVRHVAAKIRAGGAAGDERLVVRDDHRT